MQRQLMTPDEQVDPLRPHHVVTMIPTEEGGVTFVESFLTLAAAKAAYVADKVTTDPSSGTVWAVVEVHDGTITDVEAYALECMQDAAS